MGAVSIRDLSGVQDTSDDDLFIVEHTDDGGATFKTGSVSYGQLRDGLVSQ